MKQLLKKLKDMDDKKYKEYELVVRHYRKYMKAQNLI